LNLYQEVFNIIILKRESDVPAQLLYNLLYNPNLKKIFLTKEKSEDYNKFAEIFENSKKEKYCKQII
jgi:hypothetical protein